MSVSVAEVYAEVCDAILESGGLQLGLLTEAQFLNFTTTVVVDFFERTGIVRDRFSVNALSYIKEYSYPDYLLRLYHVFWDNQYLHPTDSFGLDHSSSNWENDIDEPERWTESRRERGEIQVYPAPPDEDRTFTLIGSKNTITSALTTSSTITGIPSSFTFYISAGVLERIHTMDGEMKDDFKANYFHNRWLEGINLAKALMGEMVVA